MGIARQGSGSQVTRHQFAASAQKLLAATIGLLMAESAAAQLPPWPGATFSGEAEKPPPFTGVAAFSSGPSRNSERTLTAIDPVPARGDAPQRLYWIELNGQAMTFVDGAEEIQLEPFLEIKGRGIELYSLTFDPKFPERPFVYVACNEDWPQGKLFKKRNVIRRLAVKRLEPPQADPASVLEIVSWESAGHNGCDLEFGPDGMLWASTGDGDVPGDPRYLGQTTDDLLGIVMRIDVRESTAREPYRVPADNPFVGVAGVAPETWCYGLRNPWKMEFNRANGDLLLCDNGEDSWEMVRLAERGGNGGWSVSEGTHPFRPHLKLQGPAKELMRPLVEHPHTVMRSVIGGIFYQGKKFPELKDRFIYGDYCTGTVWSVIPNRGVASPPEMMANTNHSITDIGEDHEGEVLIACREGILLKLEPTPVRKAEKTLARRLGETGLFASTANLTPASGCLPFEIIAPAWHDGAISHRFIALPPGAKLSPSDGAWQDNFELPNGAIAVQTLVLEGRRIETRVIHRKDAEDWEFYTYAWDREQQDAELIPAGGVDRFVSTSAEGKDDLRWHFPSRFECMMCHTWPGKRVMALNPAQLNCAAKPDAPNPGQNQLASWAALGVLARPPPAQPEKMARLADPADELAELEARSRAILHTNCAHCHRSGGGGGGKPEFQLPWWIARKDTGLDTPPLMPMYGLTDAKLITPGAPGKSMVFRRMTELGPGHMPLLGVQKVDHASVRVLRRWIETLK
ncbi:MAG: PQQ-dependent sugar dehydrogenase [Verrucomicrobiales bacterium]